MVTLHRRLPLLYTSKLPDALLRFPPIVMEWISLLLETAMLPEPFRVTSFVIVIFCAGVVPPAPMVSVRLLLTVSDLTVNVPGFAFIVELPVMTTSSAAVATCPSDQLPGVAQLPLRLFVCARLVDTAAV